MVAAMKNKTVSFTRMKDGTEEEYRLLQELEASHLEMTAERVLRELRLQGQETLPGYKITRLEHGLQAATRAENDGADIDWIVAALLHDIGDGLAPQNHDRFAAEIIRPFVRDEVAWVVEHHGIFQMLYYAHHLGWDRNERDKYKDHAYFNTCADFCERWDQSSFDPDFVTKPLQHFEDRVREVFSRKAYDRRVICKDQVAGLPPLSS
jgi:predicted HD phosphohydrolase